jgi:predicted phosphodiesterase
MIRLAVMSDIHGNRMALDAVLADLAERAVDQIVCLGDAIQGGPQPAETVQRLRELNCSIVMGNADDWLLRGEETSAEEMSPERLQKLRDVRLWQLPQLSAADQAFIAGFQPTITLPLEGGRTLLACHGSPDSFDDVLLPWSPQADFERLVGSYAQTVLCGGHTHGQFVRRVGDLFFFNPGSVGLSYTQHQPEDHFRFDHWAAYAILTSQDETLSLEFRQVPLDVAALIEIYRTSGRPHAAEMIIQYGGSV